VVPLRNLLFSAVIAALVATMSADLLRLEWRPRFARMERRLPRPDLALAPGTAAWIENCLAR